MGLNVYTKKRLAGYFRQKLGAKNYRKGWMKAKCPYCGKVGKYGINLSRNRTNCFRCGEHPSPINVVMYLENLETYQDFQKFLLQSTEAIYDYYEEEEVKLATHDSGIQLPEGFVIFGNAQEEGSELDNIMRAYVKKRGLDMQFLRRSGCGYCMSGPLFGYMVIPFHEDGKLVYYNARRVIGNGPRYANPTTEQSGVGKSFIIYNKEALYLYDKVYLCEGAINSATLGSQAIASGGKSLSRYQLNLMIKSPVKKFIIILDPDAKLKAIEVGMFLSQLKQVKVVFLPSTYDVNDLGRATTLKYIRETPYSNYFDLLKLKHKIQYEESTIHTYNSGGPS